MLRFCTTFTGTFTGTSNGTGTDSCTESQHNAVILRCMYLLVQVTYHHHHLAYALLCSKLCGLGQVAVMIGGFYKKTIGPQTH